jgi:hypothetical protein
MSRSLIEGVRRKDDGDNALVRKEKNPAWQGFS